MKNQWIINRRKKEFQQITEHLIKKFDLIRTNLSEWPGLYRLTILQSTLHIGTIVRMNDSRWLLYSYQPNNKYVETDLGQYGTPSFYAEIVHLLTMSITNVAVNKIFKAA